MFLGVISHIMALLAQTPGATQAAAAATTAAQEIPNSGGSTMHNILSYLLRAVYLMVCVGLVAVIWQKNTKNDGLTGLVGGGEISTSNYRGKKSYEENLSTAGNYLAISFIVLSMIVAMVMK